MLIVIYGNDTFRSRQYLKKLKNSFKERFDPSAINIDQIDLAENSKTWGELQSLFFSAPFLAPKRLIIIENILEQKNLEKNLEDIFDKLKDLENIIIFHEEFKDFNRKKSLHKMILDKLTENKELFPFPELEGFALNKWIKTYINDEKALITEDAIKALAAGIGPNLWQQKHEIDKLISYRGDGRITLEDVNFLTNSTYQDCIFQLIDKIIEKNFKESYKLLEYEINKGRELLAVWNLLIRHFRLLIQIKQLLLDNKSKADISKKIKLHPFLITRISEQSRNFTLDKLKHIYHCLVRWDEKFKSSSQDDLNRFLMELFMLVV
ncbi:MAG TPA: DNA polymerase III subunit delta [bacterium]|nr:DNA polymerase III subunit delta [bacterium]